MIPVLFENPDIVVIDKPAGISTIPERLSGSLCLRDIISEQFSQKLFVVHRLDKEVSGVMVFARNAPAHRFFNTLFESRTVDKVYRALVHGVVDRDSMRITAPIRRFGSGRMGIDEMIGLPSMTDVSVLERFSSCTLVDSSPRTGRRHQIRVHLYSIGHPVMGDLRYGDRSVQTLSPRLMLHSHMIRLRLPSGEPLSIESPIPEPFSTTLASLRKREP
ncbi:MAG: RluA family pseudouridine synthase [Desulfomonilia bacterium]